MKAGFPQVASVALAAAIVLAAGGYGVTRGLMTNDNGTDRHPDLPVARDSDAWVVVADRDVAAGMTIERDMIKAVRVPKEQISASAYSEIWRVSGQVVAKVPFASGEQIKASDICPYESTSAVTSNPITLALEYIRELNACNEPDPSTAKTTRSTWDSAHAIVQARGASITPTCEPKCVPDDHTTAWIVEVRGKFVPPAIGNGCGVVPDTIQDGQSPSTVPSPATWFCIIPMWGH